MKPKYQQSVTFQRVKATGHYRLVAATGVTDLDLGQNWSLEEVDKYRSDNPNIKVNLKDSKS